MRVAAKIIQYIYSIYAFAVFLLLMFALFPFVLVALLLGREKGGNMVYSICRFWADTALFLWGIKPVCLYETPLENRASIYVFNHISYMDIPAILVSLRHRNFRILAKAEMAKIPVFGTFYKAATVMVDRSNPEKRAESVKTLVLLLKNNISVVIAPEGTFNTTGKPLKEFYNGAFRIAIETKTPIRPMLFLDTYSLLNYHSIFSQCPGKCRTVFLPEIPVDGYYPGEEDKLKAAVFKIMETALIRYKANWITQHD
ncbi:MAG: 1-acyl-sn-glycerol-3-phosphate acyltransferase [Chitinophagaceae bacterium]|nr:1-acyl-sn-glycerol-3-phosphate acyltransferase [Chitinophagaceae bacterium]MCW5916329.1 1-acyl-sn-glycerol-3-phosphate acyltransferase [Ferruginibacter sp.]